jgi:hypothetical protein
MTYVESQLQPLGFRFLDGVPDRSVVLSLGHLKFRFDCVCPAYPTIKALGCPLHHDGPGGSSPVDEAKKIPVVIT